MSRPLFLIQSFSLLALVALLSLTGTFAVFAQTGPASAAVPSTVSGATAGSTLTGTSQTAQPTPELLLFHHSGPLPSYEVATVKPLDPDVASSMVRLPSGGSLSPLTIRRYIMNAFGAAYPPQVVGGPDWFNKDAYLIKGKVPDELVSALQKTTREGRLEQTRMMEKCLLVDRFHLKSHFETRVLPVYVALSIPRRLQGEDSVQEVWATNQPER
jgi:bla regulator protein BlaR1